MAACATATATASKQGQTAPELASAAAVAPPASPFIEAARAAIARTFTNMRGHCSCPHCFTSPAEYQKWATRRFTLVRSICDTRDETRDEIAKAVLYRSDDDPRLRAFPHEIIALCYAFVRTSFTDPVALREVARTTPGGPNPRTWLEVTDAEMANATDPYTVFGRAHGPCSSKILRFAQSAGIANVQSLSPSSYYLLLSHLLDNQKMVFAHFLSSAIRLKAHDVFFSCLVAANKRNTPVVNREIDWILPRVFHYALSQNDVHAADLILALFPESERLVIKEMTRLTVRDPYVKHYMSVMFKRYAKDPIGFARLLTSPNFKAELKSYLPALGQYHDDEIAVCVKQSGTLIQEGATERAYPVERGCRFEIVFHLTPNDYSGEILSNVSLNQGGRFTPSGEPGTDFVITKATKKPEKSPDSSDSASSSSESSDSVAVDPLSSLSDSSDSEAADPLSLLSESAPSSDSDAESAAWGPRAPGDKKGAQQKSAAKNSET